MKEVTKEAKTFDGGITPEQVEAMKSKHRKVFRVDIVDGEDTHVGYFKRPDFATIKAITKISKTDEVEAGKVLFDNCWLGGSAELRDDAVLFMAVQVQLGKLVNGCMGSLKKLVEAHALADVDTEDTFAKGCALIRANLHVNSDDIKTEEEWAALYNQALWLERWRNRNHAEMIASLFGDGTH